MRHRLLSLPWTTRLRLRWRPGAAFATSAAGVALLAGCAAVPATAPGSTSSLALPASWQGTPPGPLRGDAWQGLADALLPQLIDRALQANLDLQSALSSLARARALRDVAAAAGQPTLGLGAGATVSRSANASSHSLRTGLDAGWEADLFGTQAASVAAAQADAEAAAATLQATRLAVAAEVALDYVQWQSLRQQQVLADAGVQSLEHSLQLVQARQQAGLASEVERQSSRAALDQARARLPALQHSRTQMEHALALLLGEAPAALVDLLAQAPLALPAVPGLPAVPVPADWLRSRPDVQAAERKAASALATMAQREGERRPRLTISGNLALQAATLAALGGSGAWVAGLAASIDWTPLDGGAGAAKVAAQQATLQGARTDWQAAVLMALQDVEDSLSARAQGERRVAALERAADSASQARALARHRYQAGLVDHTVLLDSERTDISAADSLATARADLAASHIRLIKALGGSLAPAAAGSAPPKAPST